MHGPGDSEKNIKSQVQRLARNAVALAVGGIVAQLAFTLLEILVARKLGAEAYGVFVTAYADYALAAFDDSELDPDLIALRRSALRSRPARSTR